jgi:hypothetical protein
MAQIELRFIGGGRSTIIGTLSFRLARVVRNFRPQQSLVWSLLFLPPPPKIERKLGTKAINVDSVLVP